MRDLQRLIKDILLFLSSNDLTDHEIRRQMAEEYSEYCREFNRKAEDCRQMLERKMFVEANNYAESLTPSLSRMEQLLNFPDKERFLELYQMYDWPEPPQIQNDVIRKLRSMASEMKDLTPLLNAYRQIARSNDVPGKITLLRQIVKRDQNTEWKVALSELEKELQESLTRNAKNAILENDYDRLKNIQESLVSQEWSTPPPEQVLRKIEKVLDEHHREELEKECARRLDEVNNAYSGFDYPELERTLAEWDNFLLAEQYHAADTVRMQIREAREYYESQRKIKEMECDYEELVEALRNGMEAEAPLRELEQLNSRIAMLGKQLPEELGRVYLIYKTTQEQIARRKKAVMLGTVAAATLSMAVLVVFCIYMVMMNFAEREWTGRLEKIMRESPADVALKLLDDLQKQSPAIRKRPGIQLLATKIHAKKEQEDISRKSFTELLEKMREQLKDYEKNQKQLLADKTIAVRLIVDEKEEKPYRDFERDFEREKNNYMERQNSRYLKLLHALKEMRQRCFTVLEAGNVAEANTAIQKSEALAEQMRSIKYITNDVRLNGEKFIAGITDLKSKCTEEVSRQTNRRGILGDLKDPLNPAALKEKINVYLAEYGNLPETEHYRSLLEKHYPVAESILSDDPLKPKKGLVFEADHQKLNQLLSARKELYAAISKKFDKMSEIDRKNPLYALILRRQDGSLMDVYYNSKSKIDSFLNDQWNGQKRYTMKIEFLGDPRGGTRYETVTTFDLSAKGGLSDGNHYYSGTFVYPRDIKPKDPGRALAPHVAAIDGMAKELLKINERQVEDTLVGMFKKVIADEMINPYLRFLLVEILVNTLADHIQGNKSYTDMKKYVAFLKGKLPESYNWLRAYQEHEKEQRRLREDLKEMEKMSLETDGRFQEELLVTALSRKITPGGYLIRKDGKYEFVRFNSAPLTGELWLVEADQKTFRMIGTYHLKEYQLLPGVEKSLQNVLFLFTPGDKKSTLELMRQFQEKAQKKKINPIDWPCCWPILPGGKS